jgi:hypothetical protein
MTRLITVMPSGLQPFKYSSKGQRTRRDPSSKSRSVLEHPSIDSMADDQLGELKSLHQQELHAADSERSALSAEMTAKLEE